MVFKLAWPEDRGPWLYVSEVLSWLFEMEGELSFSGWDVQLPKLKEIPETLWRPALSGTTRITERLESSVLCVWQGTSQANKGKILME